jgi:phospholipid/cholesterol/gamma-HCH transport system permease protein
VRAPGPLSRLVNGVFERIVRSFETFGKVIVMSVGAARHTITDILRIRFPLKEFLTQAWFIVSVSVLPTILVAVPFGVIISIQVGSLSAQVGATSFMGAANGLGVIRQGAPIVTALLLAGAVGSAIASDLGARKIRDELDAMEAMGLSTVRRLVAPRILATMVIAVLLCGVVVFVGVVTGYAFNVLGQGGTPGSYVSSFAAFAQPSDLILALVKSVIFGGIVSVVACYKGITASGGPRGVADAVNASVVLSVVLLFAANVIITQIYATLVPQRVI